MTKGQESFAAEEINRLVSLGLNVNIAMDVANGRRDEAFEVARAQEQVEVDNFCKDMSRIPTDVEPMWDLSPKRFYLAFDGSAPNDEREDELELIEADVTEVNSLLTLLASRSDEPWDKKYKRKSCGIVYRWSLGRGVTPPLICKVQNQIHIVGGMHRFHLAMHYGSKRMPFLIWSQERDTIVSMLTSAKSVLQ